MGPGIDIGKWIPIGKTVDDVEVRGRMLKNPSSEDPKLRAQHWSYFKWMEQMFYKTPGERFRSRQEGQEEIQYL